jgi:hypothetical protein
MVIFIAYCLMSILTSLFLYRTDWLNSAYDYDVADYLFTGFVSICWIIFLPVYLLGYIGKIVFNNN